MRRTHQPSALPRPKWTLGLGVLLALGACLNPMPEEFPSDRDVNEAPTGAAGAAPNPNGAVGSGGSAGTGGLTADPGSGAGTGGSSGIDLSDPEGSGEPDAGASSPADGGSEVGDAGP